MLRIVGGAVSCLEASPFRASRAEGPRPSGGFSQLRETAVTAIGTATDIATIVSETHTRAGWTVGGGVEWAFDPNWSAKLEYLFVDFGREGYYDPPPSFLFANRAGGVFLTDNIVRAGVNWRFNWGKAPTPVVAKY